MAVLRVKLIAVSNSVAIFLIRISRVELMKLGSAIAASTPAIATVIISSIKVNPFDLGIERGVVASMSVMVCLMCVASSDGNLRR